MSYSVLTPKVFANCSPGRGPRAGSPRGVGEFPTLGLHKDEGGINTIGVGQFDKSDLLANSFRV